MRIGFDGKRATQNYTGLGNYSRYILQILARFYPENEYLVYTTKPIDHTRESSSGKNFPALNIRYPKNHFFKSLWRSFGIVKDLQKDQIGVFHGLSNEIPFGIKQAGILSIVTIHDLIFLRYPKYYPWFDRKIYEFKFRYACKNADQIIAVSEQTKRDIITFFKIPASRIQVIYQNCAAVFQEKIGQERTGQIRLKYNLPKQYLLNVGSIEARKNLLLIVKALKLIPEAFHLVVVGKETSYAEKVKEYLNRNDLAKRVHFLKNVSFDDLPGIYQQAEIFIYPSEFEGFGIPVLEALHSGVPVIAATGSSLQEAGGAGSLYVDPKNEIQLAALIIQISGNTELREKMIHDGYEHAKQFSDERIAPKLIDLYQKTEKQC